MVTKYSRYFGVASAYTDEAIAYFLAVEADGSSLTSTMKGAINQFIVSSKFYGLWDKYFLVYLFVGGTASTHRWNLKDPRNRDDAYRAIFMFGPIHSSNGVAFDGSSQHINTNFIPSKALTAANGHMSFYSRMSGQSNASAEDMGIYQSSTSTFGLGIRRPSDVCFVEAYDEVDWVESTNTDGSGLFVANRPDSTHLQFVRNGTATVEEVVSTVGTPPTTPVFIGAANTATVAGGAVWAAPSNRPCAFASIGQGFSATENTNFYTTVQAYQTALSRQV